MRGRETWVSPVTAAREPPSRTLRLWRWRLAVLAVLALLVLAVVLVVASLTGGGGGDANPTIGGAPPVPLAAPG